MRFQSHTIPATRLKREARISDTANTGKLNHKIQHTIGIAIHPHESIHTVGLAEYLKANVGHRGLCVIEEGGVFVGFTIEGDLARSDASDEKLQP